MQKSKSKYKHEEQPLKVYRYTDTWWQIAVALGLIAFVVVAFNSTMQDARAEGDPFLIGIGLAFGLFYAYLIWSIFQQFSTRVELYEHGIAVRYGSNLIYSTWENTLYLERRPRGRSYRIGIVTQEDVEQQKTGSWFERLLHHKADMCFIEVSPITVPTKSMSMLSERIVDTEKLATTEFGSYLKQYAPHLLGRKRMS